MTWLTGPRIGEAVIIAEFIGVAIWFAIEGNWPKAGYWCSAAALNIFITMM